MRSMLFYVLLGIVFSNNAISQKVPSSIECEALNSSFLGSLKKDDFQQSALLYKSLVANCSGEEPTSAPKYLAFLKKQISGEQDRVRKEQLIDTLETVYLRMENMQRYETVEDIQRVTYLINSPNSSKLKVDELLERIIHTHPEGCSESLILMYYVNLNALYTSRQGDQKCNYWMRMVNDYWFIKNSLSTPIISLETQNKIDLYYSTITLKASAILEATPYCISKLSTDETKRISELNTYISLYENAGCINASSYNQLLDSLNSLEFSHYTFLKKATYYRLNRDFSKEFSALYFAKRANSLDSYMDSIQLLEARCLFNMGNYSEAFRLGMQQSASFASELREIAIQSVLSEKGVCAQTEKQQLLNLVYAKLLVMDAKRSKMNLSLSLEKTVNDQQPTIEQLQQSGIISGQTANLDCWGISFKIP